MVNGWIVFLQIINELPDKGIEKNEDQFNDTSDDFDFISTDFLKVLKRI